MKKAYASVTSVHPYKIKQLAGKDNRWQTYVNLEGKQKQIKANSFEEICEKLIVFYQIGIEKYTVESYFDKVWVPWKSEITRKASTITQYKQHFDKYVRNTSLAKMEITKVKARDIENWGNRIIKECDLTAKAWNTKKIPLKGTFELALKNEAIRENPWNNVKIEYHLFRSQRKKASKEKIFFLDEVNAIIKESYQQYQKTHNSANLAIILNFELGLRIGELVALKYSDIDLDSREIHIQRQESEGIVEEYVKRDAECGYRFLSLSDNAMAIIEELHKNDNGEYLICKDNERMTETKVCHRLEKTQKKLKLIDKVKGSHCIRRTVASLMNAQGIPIEEIRRWLGHNDINTTLGYVYNIYRENETADMHRKNSLLNQFSNENQHFLEAI